MPDHQSSMIWRETRIPLDGRTYICAGEVTLRGGQKLPANFRVQTDLCFLLDQESVICRIETSWYRMHEPELYNALGIPKDQALPYYWRPDRPLDCEKKGPYRMDWNYLRKRELTKQKNRAMKGFQLAVGWRITQY